MNGGWGRGEWGLLFLLHFLFFFLFFFSFSFSFFVFIIIFHLHLFCSFSFFFIPSTLSYKCHFLLIYHFFFPFFSFSLRHILHNQYYQRHSIYHRRNYFHRDNPSVIFTARAWKIKPLKKIVHVLLNSKPNMKLTNWNSIFFFDFHKNDAAFHGVSMCVYASWSSMLNQRISKSNKNPYECSH